MPATPLKVIIRISGGKSSCQLRTPGNLTEVEAIATVIGVINAPAHITGSSGVIVIVVARDILESH